MAYYKNIDNGHVYLAGPGMNDMPNMKPCDADGNLIEPNAVPPKAEPIERPEVPAMGDPVEAHPEDAVDVDDIGLPG
jgi:hypothetical protein